MTLCVNAALANAPAEVHAGSMIARRLLLALVAASVGGCMSGEGELTCEEADYEAIDQRARLWSDPNACTADSDCVLAPVDITCEAENNYLGACPYVVHRDSVDALGAVNDLVAAEVCPRVRDCMAGPSCAPVEPRCVESVCVPISP